MRVIFSWLTLGFKNYILVTGYKWERLKLITFVQKSSCPSFCSTRMKGWYLWWTSELRWVGLSCTLQSVSVYQSFPHFCQWALVPTSIQQAWDLSTQEFVALSLAIQLCLSFLCLWMEVSLRVLSVPRPQILWKLCGEDWMEDASFGLLLVAILVPAYVWLLTPVQWFLIILTKSSAYSR